MIPLTAKRSFPYAGRDLKAGQEFMAFSKQDAHALVVIGHARHREHYETRVMIKPSLEGMSIGDLRALAERLGLKVHHRAGVEKIREAIRSAQA